MDQEGVRNHDYRLMSQDFKMIRELHEGKIKGVFHCVLDFHPDEKVGDDKMAEIARKYLQRIGMVNTQYIIAKHIDKSHLHVHVIANRIDYTGKPIDSYVKEMQSEEMTKDLIREYQLRPLQRKDLRQVNFGSLNEVDARRYEIYQAILKHLPVCRNLDELERRLSKEGIETRYRYAEGTGERKGISFRMGNRAFRGGKIDRSFTLPRLEKTLAEQHKLTEWEQEKLASPARRKLDSAVRELLAPAQQEGGTNRTKQQRELWEKEKLALQQRRGIVTKTKNGTEDEQIEKQDAQENIKQEDGQKIDQNDQPNIDKEDLQKRQNLPDKPAQKIEEGQESSRKHGYRQRLY